jgi:hypothetical protein
MAGAQRSVHVFNKPKHSETDYRLASHNDEVPRRLRFRCEDETFEKVARAGIEPATFRFSGGRSYQLSYLAGRHPCLAKCLAKLATLTGLEPATSAVTGRRANQLRHRALLCGSIVRGAACTPYGIRTRATALKGRRPRPLDEGGQPNLSGVLTTL